MFEYKFGKTYSPCTSIAFILLYNVMVDSIDVLKPNKELFLLYTGDHIIYNTLLSDPLNSTIAINQAQSYIQTLYKPDVTTEKSTRSQTKDHHKNGTKCLLTWHAGVRMGV